MAKQTILTEQECTFAPNLNYGGLYFHSMNLAQLEVGETYTIVWDGVGYSCVASEMTLGTVTGIGIGNGAIVGISEDSGEPFLFGYFPGDGSSACLSSSTETTHTIAVYQGEADGLVIKDPLGRDVVYGDYKKIRLTKESGDKVIYSEGEAVEQTIELDFSSGDMTVNPDEGKIFSKVSIPQPETLIPENIAEGIDIAGIVGSMAAGGSNAVFASGSFTGTDSDVTIEHNLGIVPDLVFVSASAQSKVISHYSIVMAIGCTLTAKSILGMNKSYYAVCTKVYGSSSYYTYYLTGGSLDITSSSTSYLFRSTNDTSFTLGSSSYVLDSSVTYHWIAIGGLT